MKKVKISPSTLDLGRKQLLSFDIYSLLRKCLFQRVIHRPMNHRCEGSIITKYHWARYRTPTHAVECKCVLIQFGVIYTLPQGTCVSQKALRQKKHRKDRNQLIYYLQGEASDIKKINQGCTAACYGDLWLIRENLKVTLFS